MSTRHLFQVGVEDSFLPRSESVVDLIYLEQKSHYENNKNKDIFLDNDPNSVKDRIYHSLVFISAP